MSSSLYTTAEFMWLVSWDDNAFKCSKSEQLVKGYFWMYAFMSVIVGLNALIALMGSEQQIIMDYANAEN